MLKRNTLFVDVLSIKEIPHDLLLKYLPTEFDILCTYPMFGPESRRHSQVGLSFVYNKVRIVDDESRINRCEKFLDIFSREGCTMVEMSYVEHDRFYPCGPIPTLESRPGPHVTDYNFMELGTELAPLETAQIHLVGPAGSWFERFPFHTPPNPHGKI